MPSSSNLFDPARDTALATRLIHDIGAEIPGQVLQFTGYANGFGAVLAYPRHFQ
jgi:hypothetical protein